VHWRGAAATGGDPARALILDLALGAHAVTFMTTYPGMGPPSKQIVRGGTKLPMVW